MTTFKLGHANRAASRKKHQQRDGARAVEETITEPKRGGASMISGVSGSGDE